MMQRDEDLVLEAWIRYHANLFGLRNLSVFDNGSTVPAVHRILDQYEACGMFVDRRFNSPADFAAKGDIVGERMRALRDSDQYDFLFPLDCDEFVALRTETTFSSVPAHIHLYLMELKQRPETLKIQSEFLNAPLCPGYFRLIYCNKTFYAARSFDRTDHGFHTAGAFSTDAFFVSDIAHVHYHNKPFERMRTDARRKLLGLGVPVDDLQAVAAIEHSRHLVPYFFMDERAYLALSDSFPHIYQPDFIRLLVMLGATNDSLLASCSNDQRVAPIVMPSGFSQTDYWSANPDIAATRMDALLHYCMFGYAEGRRVSPA